MDKYGPLCSELDMDFLPMAIDIYGATGPGFEEAIQLIANYISTKRGTAPVTERRGLCTELSSLVLQRTAASNNRRRLNFTRAVG